MTRPTFATAWAASRQIYSPTNPEIKVAEVIGGYVAANITSTTSPWKNTCAVRMSYILNSSGLTIPKTASNVMTIATSMNPTPTIEQIESISGACREV